MKILFITYVNRSGSTFLANLLSSSEDICVCPESDILVSLFLEDPNKEVYYPADQLLKSFSKDMKMGAWEIGSDIESCLSEAKTNFQFFMEVIRNYRDRKKPSASLIVFKAERLSFLMSRLGNFDTPKDEAAIRFLSLIRDPRAVISSQLNTIHPEYNHPMTRNVVWTSVHWNRSLSRINLFNSEKSPLLIIKFEDLISKNNKCVTEIARFLGLNLEGLNPEKGELLMTMPINVKSIHKLANQNPESERIDGWRSVLSPKNTYLIERTCRIGMEMFEYTRKNSGIRLLEELNRIIYIFTYNIQVLYRKLKLKLANF
ncbi:MAG TPA: sulfotransferase [Bacteroides sp.]|nr:sulfotransferase [Bacteroides sp.]